MYLEHNLGSILNVRSLCTVSYWAYDQVRTGGGIHTFLGLIESELHRGDLKLLCSRHSSQAVYVHAFGLQQCSEQKVEVNHGIHVSMEKSAFWHFSDYLP